MPAALMARRVVSSAGPFGLGRSSSPIPFAGPGTRWGGAPFAGAPTARLARRVARRGCGRAGPAVVLLIASSSVDGSSHGLSRRGVLCSLLLLLPPAEETERFAWGWLRLPLTLTRVGFNPTVRQIPGTTSLCLSLRQGVLRVLHYQLHLAVRLQIAYGVKIHGVWVPVTQLVA